MAARGNRIVELPRGSGCVVSEVFFILVGSGVRDVASGGMEVFV